MKNGKEEIQARVKQEASITLERPDLTGHGGTSTTGNVAKEILNTSCGKLFPPVHISFWHMILNLLSKITLVCLISLKVALKPITNSLDNTVSTIQEKQISMKIYLIVLIDYGIRVIHSLVVKSRERLQCLHCKGFGHTIRSCQAMKAAIQGCNSEFESLLCFLAKQ